MSKRKPTDASLLRSLLEEMGLSQMEASRQLGVEGRTVRRWLAGDAPVPRMAWMALDHICEHREKY